MTKTGATGPWEKHAWAGDNAYKEGNYAEAEKQCMAALRETEKFPPNDPRIAASHNNLGEIYRVLGKYEEAEQHLEQALVVAKRVFGPDHPNVASSLNCIGVLYKHLERYAESEQCHKKAIVIREKALGPENPDFAIDLNNLATSYYFQGKYAESEATHKRALLIREKILGPEHSDTGQSLHNLAALLNIQGRCTEAEPLSKRAIEIYEKTLGPDHPELAMSINELALNYTTQGKYSEAESLLKRALTIFERALGPEHPETIICRDNYDDLLKIKVPEKGEEKSETNNSSDSENKKSFPYPSAISLLYPIWDLIHIWDEPMTFLEKMGHGITNLGYLLFVAGIWGTFLIFGLKKPNHVFTAGLIFFLVGVILTNFH
jgi:tetratricopeptide (TPR) repeat protein